MLMDRTGSKSRKSHRTGLEGVGMALKVFLICEVNCYEESPGDHGSVWAAVEPFDPAKDDYTERGTKVVGPLPGKEADLVLENLKKTLEAAGVPVAVEYAADD
jgi:hypothetical protein